MTILIDPKCSAGEFILEKLPMATQAHYILNGHLCKYLLVERGGFEPPKPRQRVYSSPILTTYNISPGAGSKN